MSKSRNTPPLAARKTARKSASSPALKRSAEAAASRALRVRSPAAPALSTKKAAIVALVEQPRGVAISDLTKAPNSRRSSKQPTCKSTRKSTRPLQRNQSATKTTSRVSTLRSPTAPARPSKKAAIVALLERPDGAALSDLIKATGWQAHSVRAALTGLRKDGKELVRDKDAAGVTHYRLAAA